jgi:hypothetical protein
MIQHLREAGYPTLTDSGWKSWDLAIDGHLWSRIPIDVVVENHGGAKRLARFRISWKLTPVSKAILWTCGGFLALGVLEGQLWMVGVASLAALAIFLWITYKSTSVIHEIGEMIRQIAAQLQLLPVDGKHQHA